MIRSAGITAALKVGATTLAFGASLLYARVLGPHGYGLYAYVLAWVAVLTIPASLGLPQYLVREGAKFRASTNWLRRWGTRRIWISGGAAATLLACAVFVPEAAGARWLFVIAAPLPLINGMTSLRAALLQARGWVARSQWPLLILGPMVALAALAALWELQGTLSPIELISATTGAALLPLLINELQLRRAAPKTDQDRPIVSVRASLPFVWLGGLYLINNRADLIMLGALSGAHDAGIYAVSARAAELVTFFLAASNMVIAPRIARLHQDQQQKQLQRLVTASSRRVLAVSIPIALLFILAARPLLEYLYGTSYSEGATALQILASAQLFNVAVGPTGTILNMTGHERLCALGVGLSVTLNIALNGILIPYYGIEGAAIATGASLILWNLLLWYMIRRYLSFNSTAFTL
ncbi:MAG TPA: flippase [Gammaproteobacteria bacterium]|nr:flippase [Gammaproteobacteria bacterium]